MTLLNAFYCSCAGAFGGACFHIYWLIDLLAKGTLSKSQKTSDWQRLRLIKMVLSLCVGGAAGFMVGAWFSPELNLFEIELAKVIVIAYLAGLAGDGALGVLRKVASL
jgi:hypothetical protein